MKKNLKRIEEILTEQTIAPDMAVYVCVPRRILILGWQKVNRRHRLLSTDAAPEPKPFVWVKWEERAKVWP